MKEYNDWLVWVLEFILPRRYWYRNFYLRSKHWRSIRKRKLHQVRHTCERCIKQAFESRMILDVHHKTYAHMWHEQLYDLEVLCRKHHQEEHGHG